MLKLCRVTKVMVLFLVLVFVFNVDLFKFSAAILEKGLFCHMTTVAQYANSERLQMVAYSLSLTGNFCFKAG